MTESSARSQDRGCHPRKSLQGSDCLASKNLRVSWLPRPYSQQAPELHRYLGPLTWPEPWRPTPEAIKIFLHCFGLLQVYHLVWQTPLSWVNTKATALAVTINILTWFFLGSMVSTLLICTMTPWPCEYISSLVKSLDHWYQQQKPLESGLGCAFAVSVFCGPVFISGPHTGVNPISHQKVAAILP